MIRKIPKKAAKTSSFWKQSKQPLFGVLLASVVLSGCSTTPERLEKFSYEPNYPMNIPKKTLPKNGSLYQSAEAMTLFDDSRAHKIGDIITINLAEKFDAKKKDEAKYNKDNSQNFGLNGQAKAGTNANIMGGNVSVPGLGTGIGIGYGSSGAFTGKADVKQNSSLTGSIAVTVVEVISNGNLIIRGEKWITIHEGEEVIRFAGIVRPQDIRPDNTIDSGKVADVRLIYKDTGVSGDSARPSALTQWLHKYWPL
ncbi:MAG: flagellar biosynthesis protein FlgH [Piscirickettsiaceae bacterium CG_4_9_14_3_um_filter_43_564]|nr:flagellar basal body L-ring protein FlgH [Thiomicrospira sp.]OIP96091.1 MAG: flagellar biosynthesis protein FlgH [Thiomicrospira sp. CG2_30_44_34]PIQ02539.1 MAG: flagellar biosynthesis protein FlgH [Piscirickettsiaceae bacterium CG18_big_fil_WC_8_21_14_2_50_44_103]PIU37997.1 MAG: flagellar biosynthesis protein FlgH [Piscirickettsiaceae bacterium CG07_land_8_20_14_0_80_44_28]PIW57869.1 MAG: flagellar biosynthesis protein FlgH [Piscirickettsiaceae bacterium CG12_big_fil_rev_8_21_14_0_65_44_934